MRSRTAILRSTAFLQHDTGDHPERASRMIAIDCELERRQLLGSRPTVACTPATDDIILQVHSSEMLARLESVAAAGGGWLDSDTVVRPESLDVARMASGAAVNAIDAMIGGQIDRAFVIARPPGHHATGATSMGFCLLNTAAIAATYAIACGTERVAILDWDVHHGNGTQDIFYGRRDVMYCSLHRSPFYPGTGASNEMGLGEGAGFTVNLPLPAGTGDVGFLDAFRSTASPAIEQFGPQLLIVSAGYDAHVDDPIGGMDVTEGGFRELMAAAVNLADRHSQGRLLVVLEGGYRESVLARCVADAIEILDRAATNDSGPVS
jgi:acetoin utilization deacetylase AcuC-like enzyme